MVAIKAGQAASFLKSPDKAISAFLFYGSDAGLVSTRARDLARRLAEREDPPGDIISISDNDLGEDPDRLMVELQTAPMFGGRQVVRVSASRLITAARLKPVIEDDRPPASYLIVEAGNLKPADALRKLFEKERTSAAIACFPDTMRDLDALVGEVLRENDLEISREARQLLISRLGADHALSRGEVERLALYAHGRQRVEVADVDAIIGDESELAVDRIVLAAAAGNSALAVRDCDRAIASGISAQLIILAAQRHFQRLHRARSAMDAGRSLDEAVRALRPPLHFRQRDAFSVQLRHWSLPRLTHALARISEMVKSARLKASLETTLAERLLLELARLARSSRR